MNLNATDLLTKVGLPSELTTLLVDNNPSKHLSYHGKQHALEVAYYTQVLARELGMSQEAIKHLTVAGLIHDYNHTGDSSVEDKINVARAVQFIKDNQETFLEHKLNVKSLTAYVKATATDNKKKPNGLNECVIADADLLFWVHPDTTVQEMKERMDALQAETGKPINVETTHALFRSFRFRTTPGWNMMRKSIWNKPLNSVQQLFQND